MALASRVTLISAAVIGFILTFVGDYSYWEVLSRLDIVTLLLLMAALAAGVISFFIDTQLIRLMSILVAAGLFGLFLQFIEWIGFTQGDAQSWGLFLTSLIFLASAGLLIAAMEWDGASVSSSPPGPGQTRGGASSRPSASASATATRTSGKATAALVLGICGILVAPLICSLLAVIFGKQAMDEIRSQPELSGEGMAKAGFILGIVGLALVGLFILIFIAAAAASS